MLLHLRAALPGEGGPTRPPRRQPETGRGSVEAHGLRARRAEAADVAALLAEPVEAHLLALELQPPAFLAIVPAAPVPREVTLAAVQVLVLRHEGNRRLRREVRELAVPIP